jgi:hypothetical protein
MERSRRREDEVPGRRIDGARACQCRAEIEWQATKEITKVWRARVKGLASGARKEIVFSSVTV